MELIAKSTIFDLNIASNIFSNFSEDKLIDAGGVIPIEVDLILGDAFSNGNELQADFGIVTERDVDHDYYEGNYVVTPKVNTQSLPTADKVMKEDVSIKAIPFYEVDNGHNGTTIYIGSEM